MVSWQALLFPGSWKCHLDLYLYHHIILPLCMSLCPDFPVYMRTSVITDQGPPNDLILLQQSYFPIRSHANVLAVRTSTYESEGDIIQPRIYVIMKFSRQLKRIKLVIRLPIRTYGLLSIFHLSLPCVFISNQFPVSEEQQGFSALEILSPFGAGLLKNCSGLFSLWAWAVLLLCSQLGASLRPDTLLLETWKREHVGCVLIEWLRSLTHSALHIDH